MYAELSVIPVRHVYCYAELSAIPVRHIYVC